MPVYNTAPYLAEAIRSILWQTFTDFEFLIIDDGSTDESVAVIRKFNDPRINLLHNETNLGLVASLNRGLTLAKGDYVARMDADDISRPERLRCQVDFMDVNLRVGVCGSWIQLFPASDNTVRKFPKNSEEIQCWQFHAVGVAHPSVMLRRHFFVDNGLFYDPAYRHIEDYELWGRAMLHMEFANIQKVLLNYRIGSEQICAVYAAEQTAAMAPIRLQRLRELGIEPDQSDQELHEIIMNNTLVPEARYLDRAERWLMRLYSANNAGGAYPSDIFSRRLLEIWFSICLIHYDGAVCSWKRCLYSPLWSALNASMWHRVRAFGAWALR